MNKYHYTHYLRRTWDGMKSRCYDVNAKNYEDYGGRGITVCDRWRHSFDTFIDDMGERPEGMSIDRIDNNKGYAPWNCKWSTASQQMRNKRVQKGSVSGISGVYKREDSGNWRAHIYVNDKVINLGTFDDFFEACCARKSAENRYWRAA